jgi:tetratricopeptide (TPR) repeat protein
MGNHPSNDSKRLFNESAKAYRKAQYKLAQLNCEKALEIRRLEQPDSLDVADTLNFLGKIHWRKGDLDISLTKMKEALDIKQRRAPDSCTVAQVLQDIGCIFCERGEYEKSLHLLEGALAIREKTVPGSLPAEKVCNNLAVVLGRVGRPKEAADRSMQSLKIKEKLAPRSASIVGTYISLSIMCPPERRFELLKKARSIAERLNPPQPGVMVDIFGSLGVAYQVTGERDKALENMHKALELEQSIAPDSLIAADIYHLIAPCLEDDGQLEAARTARSNAIRIRQLKAPTLLQVKK